MINIISDIRELKVQTKALFSIDQRKLVKKLAKREISCTDTVSSDVTTPSDTPEANCLNLYNANRLKKERPPPDFLHSIVTNLDDPNRKLLAMYLKIREANDIRIKAKETKEKMVK